MTEGLTLLVLMIICMYRISLVAQMVKSLPEMREMLGSKMKKKMLGSKMKRAGDRSLDAIGRLR